MRESNHHFGLQFLGVNLLDETQQLHVALRDELATFLDHERRSIVKLPGFDGVVNQFDDDVLRGGLLLIPIHALGVEFFPQRR